MGFLIAIASTADASGLREGLNPQISSTRAGTCPAFSPQSSSAECTPAREKRFQRVLCQGNRFFTGSQRIFSCPPLQTSRPAFSDSLPQVTSEISEAEIDNTVVQTLIIDNYDSYTFNLLQWMGEINGARPLVYRNDQLDWPTLQSIPFDNIIISPGPGNPENPEDFGVCRQALLHTDVPLLGVCLGHQGLAYTYGGQVVRAPHVMHGRTSTVLHNGADLFHGIPSPFDVCRYHSLVAAPTTLPPCLETTAWTEDGIIMGLKHKDKPLYGVQFHPESIFTKDGLRILRNFKRITLEHKKPTATAPSS